MILRAIFWFSLVVMLVPVKNDRYNLHSQNVSSLRTLSLVQTIASDITSFCDRNPGSCKAANELARNYGARVQAHAEQLNGLLTSKDSQKHKDQLVTGSVPVNQ